LISYVFEKKILCESMLNYE